MVGQAGSILYTVTEGLCILSVSLGSDGRPQFMFRRHRTLETLEKIFIAEHWHFLQVDESFPVVAKCTDPPDCSCSYKLFQTHTDTCLISRVSVSNKQGGRKASVASTLDFLAMPIKVVFNLKRPAFLSSARRRDSELPGRSRRCLRVSVCLIRI